MLFRNRFSGPRALAAFALAAAVSAPAAAAAQGLVFNLPGLGQTSYSFTNTSLLSYRVQNFDPNFFDDNFFALTERYDSAFQAAPWRLQLRIDAFAPFLRLQGSPAAPLLPTEVPANCVAPRCNDYLRFDARLERVALSYNRGALSATLGDYYFVFGRGVALSFRKVDPLGLDTTIRGAMFDIDAGRISIRGFGGYANPQNLDPITLRVDHDWGEAIARGTESLRPGPDILGGAEVVARIGADEDLEIAGTALRLHAPDSVLADYDVDVVGYRVATPALFNGAVSTHTEVHALRRTRTNFRPMGMMRGEQSSARETFGRAIYSAVQYQASGWTALLEWKDYTNFYLSPDGSGSDVRRVYSGAPSLERNDVQFRTNSNVRGGRFQLERAFRPSPWLAAITLVGNGFTEENDRDPWDTRTGVGVAHGYFTLRRRGRTAAVPPAASGSAGAPGAAGGRTNPQQQSGGGDGGSNTVSSAAVGGLGGGTRVAPGEWQLIGTIGYRHEFVTGDRGVAGCMFGAEGCGFRPAGSPDWQIVHGDLDVAFSLNLNHSLEFRADLRYERRWTDILSNNGQPGYYAFWRGGIAATWSYTDRLQVSAVARIDTTAEALGRNEMPRMLEQMGLPHDPIIPTFYPAGEIRYRFSQGNTIRLFGGATPGGRLCTGGVCRDVPPFQGGILELVLRI